MKTPKNWIGYYSFFVDLEGKVRIATDCGHWVDPKNNGTVIVKRVEQDLKNVPKHIRELANSYKH
jgi:hypothetical protein